MNESQINQYNESAKLLVQLANYILNGETDKLKENNGFKELITLYLLIPYITKSQLETPDEECNIPKVMRSFCKTDTGKDITLSNLRDSMCHSFVTIDGDKNDGSNYLVFDDRAYCKNRTEHDNLEDKGGMCKIKVEDIHQLLLQLIQEINEQK